MTPAEQARRWVDLAWGDRIGHFFFAFGVGGHFDERDKYVFEHWQERPGRWPDDCDRFLAEAFERAERDDVYVAPYLRSNASRKKGNALASRLLYADVDGRDPSLNGFESLLIGPGGLLVESGQVGHVHVYLGLPDDLDPPELERLNRHLAYRLHADAGWSENKVLRLPGTWNHKGDWLDFGPWPVQIVEHPRADCDWTPDELRELLGSEPKAAGATASTPTAPVMPANVPAHLLDRLHETPDGDRSAQSFTFVRDCRQAGLSEAETLALALQHPPTREKYGDRAPAEIERTIGKLPRGSTEAAVEPSDPSATFESEPPRRLTATPLVEVEMRSIEFFDRPLWQQAAFTLLAGPKGAGKGTYLASLAARISREGRNVLFIASEDSAAIDLKPRLVAAGSVIERCFIVEQHVRLPADIDELHALALELGDVGLLVIDPVANHIGDRDSNKDAEVREAIAPLNQLADDLRCLLIGVRHPGKDRSRGAVASILGSTAWVDTPRAVVMIAVDDEDDQVRHIQVVAGNRSRNGSAQAFRIDAVDVPGLTEPITRAVPLGESSKSVDDLLNTAPRSGSDDTTRTAAARELILDILEGEGEQESDTLDARAAGETSLKASTVRNIRTRLVEEGLVRSNPERDEYGTIVRWLVSRTAAPRP